MIGDKKIDWKKAEKVKILRKCRVKEAGKEYAKDVKPGDFVTVAGRDKHELISRELAAFLVKDKK